MATDKQVEYSALLDSLEKVVMDLNDMENIIDNFDEPSAESLFAKVNEYIVGLKEVEKLAPTCRLQVPREALERLDDDTEQNPEVFAEELLTRCKDEFGQLNTRLLGIKNVRQTVADGWRRDRDGKYSANDGMIVANGVAGNRGATEGSSISHGGRRADTASDSASLLSHPHSTR